MPSALGAVSTAMIAAIPKSAFRMHNATSMWMVVFSANTARRTASEVLNSCRTCTASLGGAARSDGTEDGFWASSFRNVCMGLPIRPLVRVLRAHRLVDDNAALRFGSPLGLRSLYTTDRRLWQGSRLQRMTGARAASQRAGAQKASRDLAWATWPTQGRPIPLAPIPKSGTVPPPRESMPMKPSRKLRRGSFVDQVSGGHARGGGAMSELIGSR
jgi:hypothetical protein